MSIIKPKHFHDSSSAIKNISSITLDDIKREFESLEDLSVDVENINNCKTDYDEFPQNEDYRRPKLQEGNKTSSFKLNRSYSMKEMKQNGLQLRSNSKSSQQFPCHSIILSEFII